MLDEVTVTSKVMIDVYVVGVPSPPVRITVDILKTGVTTSSTTDVPLV